MRILNRIIAGDKKSGVQNKPKHRQPLLNTSEIQARVNNVLVHRKTISTPGLPIATKRELSRREKVRLYSMLNCCKAG